MNRLVARVARAAEPGEPAPWDLVTLDHDGRTLRRRLIETVHGERVLVDLPEATTLAHGDRLALEDGRTVEVIAAEEDLAEVRAADALHLARLAWHLGNRHLAAQIEAARILIRRDPVIERMLEGQGARVTPVREPFVPEGGAYGAGRTHGHDHAQGDHAHGDHAQGDRPQGGHAQGRGDARGRDHDHALGRDRGHDHALRPDHGHDHAERPDHGRDRAQGRDHGSRHG